eukprot:g2932.t1
MQGTETVYDPLSSPVVVEVETGAESDKKRGPVLSLFTGPSSSQVSPKHTIQDSDSETEDKYSTYGQVVGPPTQEETGLYAQALNEDEEDNIVKPDFHIRVTDPRRTDQPGFLGLNSAYTQYKVVTSRAAYEFVVWRRFREFVALDSILVEKYRGYIVPPRPEKNVVEAQRMKGSFIQERRLALEKYLNRLALHPKIKDSEELKLFLEMEGGLGLNLRWRSMQPIHFGFFEALARLSRQMFGRETFIKPNEVTNTGKKTGNLMRMMSEGVQNVKNEMQRKKPITPDEKALQRKQQFINATWDLLPDLSRAAEVFVKKFDKMSSVLGDMGLALIKMSKYEEEEGMELTKAYNTTTSLQRFSNNTKQSGIALVRLARLARKVTGKMAEDLSEIHEYLFLLPSVHRALTCRDQAFLTFQVVEAQRDRRKKVLDDLNAINEKKLGGYASKTRQIKVVSEQVDMMTTTVDAAQSEYNRIKEVNFTEIERYEKQRESDFMTMLHSLACVQAAYADRCAEVWVGIARDLGASYEEINAARGGYADTPTD